MTTAAMTPITSTTQTTKAIRRRRMTAAQVIRVV
jgi:hypothetical protein